jgi:hypothetical protein
MILIIGNEKRKNLAMIRGGKGSPYEWAFIQLDVYREPARHGFQQQEDFIINRQKRQPHERSTQMRVK